jgi:hypothetical protein
VSILLEQGPHGWDYPTVDELLDARERLDHLSDQFGWLVERHLLGSEEIHVHLWLPGGDCEEHVACVSFIPFRWRASMEVGDSAEDWFPTCVYELKSRCPCDQIQAPVLVPVVEFVEGFERVPERIGQWWAIERLQLLERCSRARGRVLKLPPDLGAYVPPLGDVGPGDVPERRHMDRELVSVVHLLASASDESRNEVVKTRSHVVGELADEELPVGIESLWREAELVLKAIRLKLTLDGIQLVLSDSLNAITKGVEVEYRPPSLEFVVGQRVAHGATTP